MSFLEVKRAIKNAKLDKAPSPDETTNNFYKVLPDNWIHYIELFFNKILYEEAIQIGWAEFLKASKK